MIRIVRLSAAALVAAFLTAPQAQAADIAADIVWVVDYSASMSGDINQIIARINGLSTDFQNAGIDPRFGAVKFGDGIGLGGSGGPILMTGLTDANGLQTALTNNLPVGGATEPGSFATSFALNNMSFRPGAVKNVIVVTDEDDDSSDTEFNQANIDLETASALFNFIGVPGSGNTDDRYGVLADAYGGAAFNILDFRNSPDAFFANFTQTKIEEIIAPPQVVPLPAALPLFLTAVAALGAAGYGRRQATA